MTRPALPALALALAFGTPAAAEAPAPGPEPAPPAAEPEPEPAPEPQPEPEPASIEIPDAGEVLPSALDTLSGASKDRIDAGEFDPDALVRAPLGAFVRSRFTVRPVAGYTTLLGPDGGHAVVLGGALGHQLYTLDSLPVQAGLDSRLALTAPVGGARGHRLEAATALCAWFGPFGPSIGPTLRWDHVAWSGGAELPSAVLVGAELGLAFDTGPVQPRIAVAPAAVVAGDRAGAEPGGVPTLLDETTWRAGVRFAGRPLHVGLDGALHRSAAGLAVEAGLVLHLQPF